MHRVSSVARLLAGALVGGLAAALSMGSAWAAEPYAIHVIEPLTGGGSFIGKGQQDNLTLLEAYVNANGGIKGQPVHFVFHDNQSSPQLTVQIANELLAARPTVLLGTPITAQCNAIAPLMKKGPVLYCLTPGVHPADSSYEFSTSVSTHDLITTLVRFFRLKGWTKLAVLTSTDSSGQDADRGIELTLQRPENAGMTTAVHEHFNPTDVSIAAQIERIASAEPQALIAWTTGAPVATIFRGLKQAGLEIPVGTTNGNQIFSQMAQYAGFLPKQLYFPSSLFPEHKGLLELDPRVEKAQQDMQAVLSAGGVKPDNQTGMVWDPALIVIAALREFGPAATPEQVRQYIAGLTGFAGINGIYDFKASPQRGLGVDNAAVVSYDGERQSWPWMSRPGGQLLAH